MYKEENLTYEEAKQIIRASVDDDAYHRQVRNTRLRAGLVTAIGFAATYAISAATNTPGIMVGFSPIVAGFGLSFLMPNIGMRKLANSVNDGSFFEGKSEKEIIATASQYAHLYNEYEKKKEGKKR